MNENLPKETLKKAASGMQRKAHGAQRPRHVNEMGEEASAVKYSNVPAQQLVQRFPDPLLDCSECPRLARFLAEVRCAQPTYHARPVLPFGDPAARLLIVGLAPGMHGANRSGRPFTGDYAGLLLYETLHRFGFASRPVSTAADDGLQLLDCRITNAVKCLPPQNKPETSEIKTCNRWLAQELAAPEVRVILALGLVAHKAVLLASRLAQSAYPFAHAARHALPDGRLLIDSYHCSRYNTQTRRLTSADFSHVFETIRAAL